jgi:hypothetical protein
MFSRISRSHSGTYEESWCDVMTRSIEFHKCSDERTASIIRVEEKAEQVASKK